MTKPSKLVCKECGEEYPVELRTACEICFGPLDVQYDYEAIGKQVTKEKIAGREKTLWRYIELLPIENRNNIVNLHPGFTPLKKADQLAKKLGLRELYVKDDTVNPTYSFKDRPSSVAVSKSVEFGLEAVGCASTGNLAGATAAHAAKAGLPCYIFIPADLEQSKVLSAQIYGPNIIAVEGTYDDANRIANLAANKYKWGLVNINIRPYYTEGSKTLAYEVCEQLGWQTPDRVIIPLGSGALLCAINKGFNELVKLGFVYENKVKICGSQPDGCAPIANAYDGKSDIIPIEKPTSIVKSLAIGDPASGPEALKIINESRGFADSPNDLEVVEGQKLLARTEGIFAEPAGGVVIAALKRKVEAGEIDKNERVVVYITGNGLKTPDVLFGKFPEPTRAKPNFEDVDRAITELKRKGSK
ncbi:Threonine synthase [Candidatus Gugararchaeum adminiculabundum]|nr:Threonine synthase [Candidatus Gugararchaeum adminiculabundum]